MGHAETAIQKDAGIACVHQERGIPCLFVTGLTNTQKDNLHAVSSPYLL
jgi:hypothetical protein